MKRLLNTILFGGPGAASPLADFGLAVLRVSSGLFLAIGHGWGKVTAPSGFIDNAVRGNFPVPDVSGWFAILGEFLGGLLLAAGLATRAASLWIIAVMAGAAVVTHGDSFTSRSKFFLPADGAAEPAVLYLLIAVAFAVVGSGRFGADRFLRKP